MLDSSALLLCPQVSHGIRRASACRHKSGALRYWLMLALDGALSGTLAQLTEASALLQLALDNALAPFFENNFGFGITKAANLAAIFGMMNFFSRPLSGLFSDLIARRYGMRGRIWWLWFVVAGGGEPSYPPRLPCHKLGGICCQSPGSAYSCTIRTGPPTVAALTSLVLRPSPPCKPPSRLLSSLAGESVHVSSAAKNANLWQLLRDAEPVSAVQASSRP